MSELRELRPARPEPDGEKPAYMPRLPWKWIGGLGLFLAVGIGFYNLRQAEEAAALRTVIQRSHKRDLGPVVSRFEKLVGKINGWTVAASRNHTLAAYVDPRLNLDALHKGKGLYMRLSAHEARTAEGIISGLQAASPDAIARCLGLAPASVGELYARGTFLTSKWIDRVDNADGVMTLRVIADEIRQRSRRDLPFVAEAVRSDWFMLALQHGENRREAPVDVYLYDLRSDKLLLRLRAKADGALVAARIAIHGVEPGNYASGAQTGAAADCSIAAEVRAMTGVRPNNFGADPPEPRRAMQAGTPTPTAPGPAASPGQRDPPVTVNPER